MTGSQSQFSRLFLLFAVALMVLPFITTFNSLLTTLFLKWELYKTLQEIVVPYESKVIAGVFNIFNFATIAVDKGVWVNGLFIEITWNCLGWQSALLLFASLLGGFQKNFSWSSRWEVLAIGVLGTYLINILRMVMVGFLAVSFGRGPAIFFHDYLALLLVIVWLFAFWWFSYTFVLEETKV